MGRPVVIVADDEGLHRLLLVCALQAQYQVREAADGQEVIRYLDQEAAHIVAIVTDLHMPVLDGWAVLEAVTTRHLTCLVIVVSAETNIEQDARWQKYPQVLVRPKPVNPHDITQLIAAYCEALTP